MDLALSSRRKCKCIFHDFPSTYQVPGKVGEPVDDRVDATDKLQMFRVGRPLLYQIHGETGRYEGHGKYHTDSNHNVFEAGVSAKKHQTTIFIP